MKNQTIRQRIISLLSERPHGIRDLSKILQISEKEVPEHLEHVARSVSSQKKKLVTLPFQCFTCGYVFTNRKRFTRPGRCPKCRGGPIEEPRFQIT
ncbi:MAG: ArsR family transcriptional regulator [Proteobacteria bacterium]|nr:ArsR family transcriptional regulator [Pseudomonadota bacterium]